MIVLINLAGGIALLLWGIRMVRTGVTRAFGASLRKGIAVSTGNRVKAFLAGLGVTAILQSSTATALIVTSFAARGLIATGAALAVMLGADVGSTLVLQVLSLNVHWLAPFFIAVGVLVFLTANSSKRKNYGRICIGLGLMLQAIGLIVAGSEPLRSSPTLSLLLEALAGQPMAALVVAALLTWAAHSSLTVLLLVMSFASMGMIGNELAVAMILGANIGGAFAPVAATFGSGAVGRRVPVGNFLMRAVGGVACLVAMPLIVDHLSILGDTPERLIANFHTAFNLALALVCMPFVPKIGQIVTRMLPEREEASDDGRPSYLDAQAFDVPAVALACAGREALRLGDFVERMLARALDVFTQDDEKLAKEIETLDDTVDRLHEAIKIYLTRLTREELDDPESRRAIEILSFTTNLEHVGDIIDKNLMELAAKKIKNRTSFSDAGLRELSDMHERVVENLRLALNVFMSSDVALARKLLQEKVTIRDLERRYSESHFRRIGQGLTESIETSSLHLDILRDLKRINSHLTSVAYPLLEEAGELSQSRLVTLEDREGRLSGSAETRPDIQSRTASADTNPALRGT